MPEPVHQAIQGQLIEGRLPCARAIAIAANLGLDPIAVGRAADDAGIRISHCQLGLFGFGPKAEGRHKVVRSTPDVDEAVASRLRSLAPQGAIRCEELWTLAAEMSTARIDAAGAAESLGIRVSHCQLGCFPRPKERR